MDELAELAGFEQLAGEPDRRHEAVVEAAHVHDARLLRRGQMACASVASSPSGFSQRTCLPAWAAAIVGSACKALGPPLSKSPIRSSVTCSRQSVTASAQP